MTDVVTTKEGVMGDKVQNDELIVNVLEEEDRNGNQVMEIRGERFYYVDEGKRGKGSHADHVWASASGAQLIFRGPDYRTTEYRPPLVRGA